MITDMQLIIDLFFAFVGLRVFVRELVRLLPMFLYVSWGVSRHEPFQVSTDPAKAYKRCLQQYFSFFIFKVLGSNNYPFSIPIYPSVSPNTFSACSIG